MRLYEIVAWYQKKIGTYDKQQWEKTVEQRILDGFNNGVILKTAKLKTELIDVDLVRGSTFPKAKPKQSLLTVIRLAILRYLLLPIYAQWWVKQTSPNIFAILLTLYITQMINWAIYTFNINRSEQQNVSGIVGGIGDVGQHHDIKITNLKRNGNFCGTDDSIIDKLKTTTTTNTIIEHTVSLSDLIIPMVLSLILCFIHSQIVATNTLSESSKKRRCLQKNAKQNSKVHREHRVRRRKKIVRIRNCEIANDVASGGAAATTTRPHCFLNPTKLLNMGLEKLSRPITSIPFSSNTELYKENKIKLCKKQNQQQQQQQQQQQTKPPQPLKIDLNGATTIQTADDDATDLLQQKRRNVNWQHPIDNLSNDIINSEVINNPSSSKLVDNFSHITSSSTSSSSSTGIPLRQHIDNYVREFYDDLLNRTEMLPSHNHDKQRLSPINSTIDFESGNNIAIRRKIGEDDGFESLNGKSSSGEENLTIILAPPSITNDFDIATTSSSVVSSTKKQLRLRLNVNESIKQSNEIGGGGNTAAKTPTTYQRRQMLNLTDTSDSSGQQQQQQRATTSAACAKKLNNETINKNDNINNNTSDNTDEEDDDVEMLTNQINNINCNECTTSATEWLGITTNSDDCSYSSELDHTDDWKNRPASDEDSFEVDFTPTTILNSHGTNDRISCTVWEHHEVKKAQMSVLEISSGIIERVESMPESNDYIYFGIFFSILLSFIPIICRVCEASIVADKQNELNYFHAILLLWEKASFSFESMIIFLFGQSPWEQTVLIISFLQRLFLTGFLFIIFSVAERTFKHRFLYAKLFSHITSSRRARKSNLPHFRLNKVRNIKTWLSVRSYLKKRGPQRSVDVIVSAAFVLTLLLLAFLSVEWLKDSGQMHSQFNIEALIWAATIGIFLLRFMTLGNKIHQKYRSVSVLITEQINLYLQIEQKPKKKDELMVSNSVLKLAADLLKELETPFKISGLSANPYLFTTIKVVILSALSGVLSEMLGFKLKLHKIKIK